MAALTNGWSPADLLPGLYLLSLGCLLAAALRRWYDPVPLRAWALFAALLALLFGRVLFGGAVLLPLGSLSPNVPYQKLPASEMRHLGLQGDLVHQIAPWLLQVRRAVGDGRWPLWNPLTGAGMPLMGDPQSQAFQPLVLAVYPLDLWAAVGVTAALRVLFALVFLFLLLRRQGLGEPAALCGSLAFGLGGFLLLWLGWPMANSAALLPAALYAVVRCEESGATRDGLLLFLAVASLLLGGHPETVVYALAFTGLFLLARLRSRWRRDRSAARAFAVRTGLALVLAGLAVAPVLLSVQDYLPKTHRASLIAFRLAWRPLPELWRELQRPESLAFWRERTEQRLLPIAAPRAFGDFTFYWGDSNVIEDSSGFAGTATLLLAALAFGSLGSRGRLPQERFMAVVLVGCLALLAQPPGFEVLAARLPLIGATAVHRYHRLLLVICFCLAYLAACQVERRTRGGPSRPAILLAAAALAGLVVWGYLAHPHPENPAMLAEFRQQWLWLQIGALAVAAGLLLLPGRRSWRPWAFCGLIAAELLVAHLPANSLAPRRLAYPVTPPVRFLRDHLGDARMLGVGHAFPANFPTVYGLADVRIDNPSMPGGYAHLVWPLRRQSLSPVFGRPMHPLYDLLGVRYVITRPQVRLPLPLVFRHRAGWIYERPRPLPRLFLPASAEVHRAGSWATWLERNPDFAARSLVQEGPESPERRSRWRARAPGSSAVAISALGPAHVGARALLAERRLLASSIYQDGHWHLLVGGERRPALLANGPFVAAWLAAGEWEIDLVYRPRPFVAGCALAALALAAAAAVWVPPPRRSGMPRPRGPGVLS